MTLPEQLRAIADRIEAAEAARRSAIATLAELAGGAYNIVDELGRSLDADAAEVMRDGSSIEPDSASVQVADEGAGGEAERSLPPPDAPIEQVTPDGSPGSGSARRRQPTISPASPGTDAEAVRVERTPADQAGERGIDTRPPLHSFDPLGLVGCPDCDQRVKPSGLGTHRRLRHGYRAAARAPISCPECGEAFAQARNLPRHRRAVHGVEPWQPKPEVPGNGGTVLHKGAEWFICSRCPLKFPTRATRDAHQASHPPIPDVAPVRTVGGGGTRRVMLKRRAA